jgi:hypothetical protein
VDGCCWKKLGNPLSKIKLFLEGTSLLYEEGSWISQIEYDQEWGAHIDKWVTSYVTSFPDASAWLL